MVSQLIFYVSDSWMISAVDSHLMVLLETVNKQWFNDTFHKYKLI